MRKQARTCAALFAIRGGGSRVSTSSAEAVAALFGSTRTALLAGLAVAAILSFAAGQALRGFLYGLSPVDPVAYIGTARCSQSPPSSPQ